GLTAALSPANDLVFLFDLLLGLVGLLGLNLLLRFLVILVAVCLRTGPDRSRSHGKTNQESESPPSSRDRSIHRCALPSRPRKTEQDLSRRNGPNCGPF